MGEVNVPTCIRQAQSLGHTQVTCSDSYRPNIARPTSLVWYTSRVGGVPIGVMTRIQGHMLSVIAGKHYRCSPLDLLRKWHPQIEGWILEQSGIE